MKQVWQTDDGKTFETVLAAKLHEELGKTKLELDIEKVKKCYGVKDSISSHGLDHHGNWELRGEDPNCDYGGHHHEPLIGRYSGTLGVVIGIAAQAEFFFGWGNGGSIKLVEFKSV